MGTSSIVDPVDPGAPAADRPTIVHVMTVPQSLAFLRGQIAYVKSRGFTVHAVSSPGPELVQFAEQESVPVHAVSMSRRITPLQDLVALFRLWRVLRELRPEIVHAHTPKAALLALIAARVARSPIRIYHLRGLPFVTATGWRRLLLRATETVSCALAHRVIAVSHSMRAIAIDEGFCHPAKIKVLLGGSGNGVDSSGTFRPRGDAVRSAERARLGIPSDALVIGFVGRLVRDKGVVELAGAWRELSARHPALHLVLAGPFEAQDALPAAVAGGLRADPRVHLAGVVRDMPRLYSAMDVVALPTYREGFPNVALEAAAMSLPIVATSVPGCTDAVLDGVTGILVPARDAAALSAALERYARDADLRLRHGEAARRRVVAEFRREAIWEALVEEYRDLLARHGPAAARVNREAASG